MTHTNPSTVQLGGQRYAPNLLKFVMDLLAEQWNAAHTDSRKPIIKDQVSTKGFIFRDNDYIIIYTTPLPSEPVAITYEFTNERETVTLDFFIHGDATHAIKVIEEARRILLSRRKDVLGEAAGRVLGRSWLKWGTRITNLDQETKAYRRRIVDCEVLWRFRPIEVS